MVRRAKLKACATLLSLLDSLLVRSSGSGSSVGGGVASRAGTPQKRQDLPDPSTLQTNKVGPSAGEMSIKRQHQERNLPRARAALEQPSSSTLGEDWQVIDHAHRLGLPGYRNSERFGPPAFQEEVQGAEHQQGKFPDHMMPACLLTALLAAKTK